MTDLHKALTDLCDEYHDQGGDVIAVPILRSLLAWITPTAPDLDRRRVEEIILAGVLNQWVEGSDVWERLYASLDPRPVVDKLIASGALLAEHPPTAAVVDRELLGSEPDLRQVLAKVIEDAWQRGDSDVDAIIAYLDGGEGS